MVLADSRASRSACLPRTRTRTRGATGATPCRRHRLPPARGRRDKPTRRTLLEGCKPLGHRPTTHRPRRGRHARVARRRRAAHSFCSLVGSAARNCAPTPHANACAAGRARGCALTGGAARTSGPSSRPSRRGSPSRSPDASAGRRGRLPGVWHPSGGVRGVTNYT